MLHSVKILRRFRLKELKHTDQFQPSHTGLSVLSNRLAFSNHRCLSLSSSRRNIPSWPNPPSPQPTVTPLSSQGSSYNSSSSQYSHDSGTRSFLREWASSSSFQAALTTLVGLGVVFAAGVGYFEWYKSHVSRRVEMAFAPGYDPALELSTIRGLDGAHIRRKEQPLIDSIFRGEHAGGYYLLIGPKGTGKGTMILE
jgi:hypothetical protein